MGPTTSLLQQTIEQNHAMAEDGHRRLRQDIRTLLVQQAATDQAQTDLEKRMSQIEARVARPTEVSSLRFTPGMVGALLLIAASIIGGYYASTYGLRPAIDNIAAQINTQKQVNDERMIGFKEQLNAVQRLQQLQQYDIQSLKEQLSHARHP